MRRAAGRSETRPPSTRREASTATPAKLIALRISSWALWIESASSSRALTVKTSSGSKPPSIRMTSCRPSAAA